MGGMRSRSLLPFIALISVTLSGQEVTTACACFGAYNAKGEAVDMSRPMKAPLVNGTRVSSDFGMRMHPIFGWWAMHCGVDIAAPSGTPIFATGAGIIEGAGPKGGYGNFVLVRHSRTLATAYAHASRFAPGIYPGARVKKGQVIAYVGSTGVSTGPHLHYEILVNNRPVKPVCGCIPQPQNQAQFEQSLPRIHEAH